MTTKTINLNLPSLAVDRGLSNYLTEINITSPTGMREIKHYAGEDVSDFFFNCLESKDQ